MPVEVQPGSWAERGVGGTLRRLASDWGAPVLLMVLTLTFGAMMALVFREQVAAPYSLAAQSQTQRLLTMKQHRRAPSTPRAPS